MDIKQKGSRSIFPVVLLLVIFTMVVTLSIVTVLETKMSQKTKSSIRVFNNAQSGLKWALNQISGSAGSNIVNAFPSFSGGKVSCPAGYSCDIYFLDDQKKTISDAGSAICKVKIIRSVGTQNVGGAPDARQVIETAVAESATCMNGIVKTISSFPIDTIQKTFTSPGETGTTGWKTSPVLPATIPSTAHAILLHTNVQKTGFYDSTFSVSTRKDSVSSPIIISDNVVLLSGLAANGLDVKGLYSFSSARTFDYKVDWQAVSGTLTMIIDVVGYME